MEKQGSDTHLFGSSVHYLPNCVQKKRCSRFNAPPPSRKREALPNNRRKNSFVQARRTRPVTRLRSSIYFGSLCANDARAHVRAHAPARLRRPSQSAAPAARSRLRRDATPSATTRPGGAQAARTTRATRASCEVKRRSRGGEAKFRRDSRGG